MFNNKMLLVAIIEVGMFLYGFQWILIQLILKLVDALCPIFGLFLKHFVGNFSLISYYTNAFEVCDIFSTSCRIHKVTNSFPMCQNTKGRDVYTQHDYFRSSYTLTHKAILIK